MLQVRINQTFGWIGVEQTPASIRVEAFSAQLQLKQKQAALQIRIDWPAVSIDQTQTLAGMGYKKVVAFQKDIARNGQAIALAGIRRTAEEGDRLGRIEAGGNPLPEIAQTAAWPEKNFNVALIPKNPPDISFSGDLDIKAVPGAITVDSQAGFPQISVQKGNVDIYLKVKPAVEIGVTGQWIDLLG